MPQSALAALEPLLPPQVFFQSQIQLPGQRLGGDFCQDHQFAVQLGKSGEEQKAPKEKEHLRQQEAG